MRKILFVVFALLIGNFMIAQMPGGGGNRGAAQQMTGAFYGKIIDSITGKPIEAASVQLTQNRMDTATKKRRDFVIGGQLTKNSGEFNIENIPVMGQYVLKISAIGFKSYEKKVSLVDMNMMKNAQANTGGNQGDMMSMLGNLDKDLGNIKLVVDEKVLTNVTVSASSKPLVQLGIDRKIYNVEKDLTTAGGTAVDVMKNVPSVSVDIDGNVALRNATPQIYVDGRPTTLTLDQIPADQISSVEVITNPSAKYDASGGTAGILNIVLKKNRKAGYNGNIRGGVDERGKINGGGDINIRQGKINFFANGNYGQRKSISNGVTDRYTFLQDTTNLHQVDRNENDGHFAFGRVGIDYFVDNRNTITVSGLKVHGRFDGTVNSDILVDTIMSPGIKTSYTNRLSNSTGQFDNLGGGLSYLHNFPKNGHQVTADLNYNKSKNKNQNLIYNSVWADTAGPQTSSYNQQQLTGGQNEQLTGQVDYSNPISDKTKFESGARFNQRKVDSRSDFSVLEKNGTVTPQWPLSSRYNYTERIYAAYASYTGRGSDKFGYQVGLRLESSEYNGTVHSYLTNSSGALLKDTAASYSNSYAINFFPSLFLSQKLTNNQELQLNYSRRINRPNFFQLYPFTDFSDSLNLSRGNPNLKPEFTNSFEISYQKSFPKSNSLLVSAYSKFTNDLITRYQKVEQKPVTGDTVFVNTYMNANSSFVGGIEFIVKNKVTKWWDITTNLNLYTSKINAENLSVQTVGQLYSWFGKINSTFKLPKNFTFQLNADYTSKTVLPPGGSASSGGGGRGMGMGFGSVSGSAQSYTMPNYGVDAALKYEFLKNKAASITMNVSDIFKTRKNDVYSDASYFNQHSVRTRDQQFFRINFAYRFGKFDATLFKKKNIKGDQENMQNSMQGVQQ
jgi:outer membrane receptor protein involved in Fe transport